MNAVQIAKCLWGSLVVTLLAVTAGCPARPIVLPSTWNDRVLETKNRRLALPKLAVLPLFESESATGNANLPSAAGIFEYVSTALARTGRFDLVERNKIEEVLREQDFGRSGRVDQTTAAAIGRISGAGAVFFGTISSASQQTTDRFAYDVIRTEVRIDARAVDTETGEFIFTQSAVGVSEAKVVTDANGTVLSGVVDTELEYHRAAADAVIKLANNLSKQFPATGVVVAVTGDQMVIDLGSRDQIEIDHRLVVIRPLERMVHPNTGQFVGWKKEILGVLKVTAVEDATSIAVLERHKEKAPSIKTGDVVVLEGGRDF